MHAKAAAAEAPLVAACDWTQSPADWMAFGVPVMLGSAFPPAEPEETRLGAQHALVRAIDAAIAAMPAPVQAEISQLLDLLIFPPTRRLLVGLREEWARAEQDDIRGFLYRWRESRFQLLRAADANKAGDTDILIVSQADASLMNLFGLQDIAERLSGTFDGIGPDSEFHGKVSGWDSTPGDDWDGVFMRQQIGCQAPCCKSGPVTATTGAARADAEPGVDARLRCYIFRSTR